MLKKVRLRLLLNNMAVFTVIFSLLFIGIWTLMHRNIVLQTEGMLARTVNGERWPMPPAPDAPAQMDDEPADGQTTSGTDVYGAHGESRADDRNLETVMDPDKDIVKDPGKDSGSILIGSLGRFAFPLSRNAFVLFNADGSVAAMYGPDSIDAAQTEAIAGEILKLGREKGILRDESVGSSYRYLTRTHEDGRIAVAFTDSEVETAVVGSLLSTFLVVGFLSLLCIFISSWFLTNRALVPIRQAWDRQNRFVADASHELRTPMTAISTNLDVILSCPEDTISSQQKWFLNIRRAYQRMNTLVDDLLFLARSDAGELTDPVSSIDLKPEFEETLDTFEAQFLKNNLSLDSTRLESVVLKASGKRIRQVMAILLDNAVKYTHPGGAITVGCRKEGSRAEFSVQDTGIGMEAEHLDRIFERFYRVDPSRTRDIGGNGMGLAIARQIVSQHGGTLQVDSAPGQGSTFVVSLPANGRESQLAQVFRLFRRRESGRTKH